MIHSAVVTHALLRFPRTICSQSDLIIASAPRCLAELPSVPRPSLPRRRRTSRDAPPPGGQGGAGVGLRRGPVSCRTCWTAPEGTPRERAPSSTRRVKLRAWSPAHWGVCLLGFPSAQRLLPPPPACGCEGGTAWGTGFRQSSRAARGRREAQGCCQAQGRRLPYPAPAYWAARPRRRARV